MGSDRPNAPVVTVAGLSKDFALPREQVHTLKERALHPFRYRAVERFPALKDVSFAVEPGEFFGIVGRNGSGKSTLLKCLAGIYRVDAGEIYVDGRLSAFIELGVGFNMDLAARDNIVINGVMLGLTVREARRRANSVLAFAELEEFEELKLKNYSSGMLVRLAFSVMIQVDADVLLIDEVLAVGDASFQQKCFDEFVRIREGGRTVLLVTHDMGAVERFCDRAMLLERGEMKAIGDPRAVANEYVQVNFAREAVGDAGDGDHADDAGEDPDRFGDGRAEILKAWFEDEDGAATGALPTGRPCAFAAQVRFNEEVTDPVFGFALQREGRQTVLAASTERTREQTGRFAAGQEVVFRIRFSNIFSPGRYTATPAVARRGAGIAWIDRRERFVSVLVTGTHLTDAAVEIPYEVELSGGGPEESAPPPEEVRA